MHLIYHTVGITIAHTVLETTSLLKCHYVDMAKNFFISDRN